MINTAHTPKQHRPCLELALRVRSYLWWLLTGRAGF
jgi:hypothetical protein